MIFITPYIIKNEEDGEDITIRKGEGLEEFRKQYGIEKKSVQPTMLTPTTSEGLNKQNRQEQAVPAPGPTAPGLQSAPTGSTPDLTTAPTNTITGPESAPTAPAPGSPPDNAAIGSAPTGTAAPVEGPR